MKAKRAAITVHLVHNKSGKALFKTMRLQTSFKTIVKNNVISHPTSGGSSPNFPTSNSGLSFHKTAAIPKAVAAYLKQPFTPEELIFATKRLKLRWTTSTIL